MKDKKIKTIEKITSELFKLLDVAVESSVEKDQDEVYQVKIKTEEGGILIGSRGETLRGLKNFLTLALFKKLGEWVAVLVDVNDYWVKREKDLREMAARAAERVVATGEPVDLPFLSAQERRIIHLALASHPQVMTESEGEGRERRVMVKLKP